MHMLNLVHLLNMDENQITLAKKAIELNKKIVLVLVQGRPRIIYF